VGERRGEPSLTIEKAADQGGRKGEGFVLSQTKGRIRSPARKRRGGKSCFLEKIEGESGEGGYIFPLKKNRTEILKRAQVKNTPKGKKK